MNRIDITDLEALLLLSTNVDSLHRSLPDALFPGEDAQAQKQAREKQLSVIIEWRERLAIEENRILDEES